MNGYIIMNLLSDTCTGTGMGISGIVDTEVCCDNYGIPFVPSKRIIGILKEQATLLNAISGFRYEDIINNLFGKKGEDHSGKLTLRNGVIAEEEELACFIANLEEKKRDRTLRKMLTPAGVLSMFTSTRTLTEINEDGVAKENSLRVMRVINKGNKIYFPISVSDCTDEEEAFLKDAIACMRHIGTSRNRGLGLVECRFVSVMENPPKAFVSNKKATKVRFSIKLKSECVLDRSYVPASAMFGVCTSLYLKAYGLTRATAQYDDKFKRLFMSGLLKLTDAYPSYDHNISIPTPRCFKFEKDNEDTVMNLLKYYDENKRYTGTGFEFCQISDKSLRKIIVDKTNNFHHVRDEDPAVGRPGKKDSIYEYEATASGTIFTGEIESTEENIEILTKLLHNTTANIGKSRKSQYGLCEITIFEANNSEAYDDFDLDDFCEENENLSILLLSDMIVLNKYGIPTLSLDDVLTYMKSGFNEYDISIVHKQSFTGVSKHDGFNSKRRLPEHVFTCLSKGSVITIDISLLDIDRRKGLVKAISCTSIGEYTKSGCGKMTLLPKYDQNELRLKNYDGYSAHMTEKESPLLNILIARQQKIKIKEDIKQKIFSDTLMNCDYFGKIYNHLLNADSNGPVRFLQNQCLKKPSLLELKECFNHAMEKETYKRRKPYTDLHECLQLCNEELTIAHKLKELIENCPNSDAAEYYNFTLLMICQNVALKRRKTL